jgi:hypothetical protein
MVDLEVVVEKATIQPELVPLDREMLVDLMSPDLTMVVVAEVVKVVLVAKLRQQKLVLEELEHKHQLHLEIQHLYMVILHLEHLLQADSTLQVVVPDQQNHLVIHQFMHLVVMVAVVIQKLLDKQTLVVVAEVDIGMDFHLEGVQKKVVPVSFSSHIPLDK